MEKAKITIDSLKLSVGYEKILCALIYYCEGAKRVSGGISFTNSDENLVALFLRLFRNTFSLDEKKFSVCIHLHSYHDKNTQLKYWSKITNIPIGQFVKPYFKPSLHLYKKEGYQGCVNIRYGSAEIAREMKALAIEYMGLSVNGKPTDSKSVTPRSSRGGPAEYIKI